jgi:hypothetical protein
MTLIAGVIIGIAAVIELVAITYRLVDARPAKKKPSRPGWFARRRLSRWRRSGITPIDAANSWRPPASRNAFWERRQQERQRW